jgi:hypothetical protein
MACPLFLPVSPLAGLAPEAAPLGDVYGGECAADPGGTLIPIDTLRRCCNTGYARIACVRARQANSDATSFLIKADREGVIEVAWAMERDHHPVAVGTLQLTGTSAAEEPLARQAHAFAAAYLRQNNRQRNR